MSSLLSFAGQCLYWTYMYTPHDDYISHSLNTDLSNIPNVYQTNGGRFLVATKDNQIVGMVAGEFKQEIKGRKVYELRRMSVDRSMQGRGVGKRLVQCLERDLHQVCKIFLDCSSVQYAAHRLYLGQGFRLINKTAYEAYSPRFMICQFEKEYDQQKNC